MRRLAGVVFLVLVAVPAFNLSHATATKQPTSSPYMDSDRNSIFDDLDRAMANETGDRRHPVIVLMTQPITDVTIQSLHDDVGNFTIDGNKDSTTDAEGKPFTIIPAFSANLTDGQIKAIAQRSDVQQVELDLPIKNEALDTEKVSSGIQAIRDNFGYTGDVAGDGTQTYSANDITVCVLDTGIYPYVQDLDAAGHVAHWKDFVDVPPWDTPDDEKTVPHGTWVSGVLAGEGDLDPTHQGIAPGVKLAVGKVNTNPLTSTATVTQVISGINWCKDNATAWNIKIMTLSLGVVGTECSDGTDSLAMALDSAWDAGLVVTVAADNDGSGYCTIFSPGTSKKAITVGAMTDPDNAPCNDVNSGTQSLVSGWQLWPSSSRGRTADGRIKPDIVAPGVCITTPNRPDSLNTVCGRQDYCTVSGTSLATPFVAGVAALMMQANASYNGGTIKLTNTDVKRIISNTAEVWGPTISSIAPYNYDYGGGRIRPAQVVIQAINRSTVTQTEPSNPAHFGVENQGIGQLTNAYDAYNITVVGLNWRLAADAIVPTVQETTTTLTATLSVIPPSGSACLTNSTSSSSATTRQLGLAYDVASCGLGTYQVRIDAASGTTGPYWLDLSGNITTPVMTHDD